MPAYYEVESISDWTVFIGAAVVGGGGGIDLTIRDPDNGDRYRIVYVGGGAGVGAGLNFGEDAAAGAVEKILLAMSIERAAVNNLLINGDLHKIWIHPLLKDVLSISDVTQNVMVVQGSVEFAGQIGLTWMVFRTGMFTFPAVTGIDIPWGQGLVGAKAVAGQYTQVYFNQLS